MLEPAGVTSRRSQALTRGQPKKLAYLCAIHTLAEAWRSGELSVATLNERAHRLEPWILMSGFDGGDRWLWDLATTREASLGQPCAASRASYELGGCWALDHEYIIAPWVLPSDDG